MSFAQADEEDEAIFEVSNQPLIPLARPSVLQPPSSTNLVPKVVTKAALQKESQMREQLRQEFLATQQAVRATEIAIPYVFYDGSNTPGGICRMKKGEQIWLFLDKARKVGAEKAVGVAGQGRRSRGEWARIGVDDLMLVKGDLIIPHVRTFAV